MDYLSWESQLQADLEILNDLIFEIEKYHLKKMPNFKNF